MSGDVQPRKRKDKKKKKEDGDPIPEKLYTPIFTNNAVIDDVNIHVHKEESTGGGICAKLVFFILFSALAALIGLIITEHRGLTDIDTVDPNSKFSQLFEGWVDTNANSHTDHDASEHETIDDDDHDVHEGDEHDNHVSEEVDETEHDHSEEEDDDEQLDENLSDEDEKNENDTEDDDEDEGINEIVDEDEDDDKGINEIDDEDEDEDNDKDNSYETDTKRKSKVAISEEDEYDQEQDEDDQEHDNIDDDNEIEDQDDVDQEDDNDEEDNGEISREKKYVSEEKMESNEDDDTDTEDNIYDAHDGDDNIDDEKDDEDKLESSEKETNGEQIKTNEKDLNSKEGRSHEDKIMNAEPEEELKEDVTESSGMAVKIGVGVALLVVAHLVLVKKWRTASDDNDKPTEISSVPNLQDRRNTIIVPPPFKEVEPDIEPVQEDYSEEDEDEDMEEDEKLEINTAKAKYQELATAYTHQTISDKGIDRPTKPYDYEIEDEELEEEVEEEEELESDEAEREYDEEVDEEDEDEELLKRLEARYGRIHNEDKKVERDVLDSAKQSDDDYDNTNINNEDDYKIRQEIDEAQSSIKNNNAHAITLFDIILHKFPSSPRALYGKALAFDHLAEKKRSNEILENALQLYEKLLKIEKVPIALFNLAADRCINRWRFLGQYRNAINIHKIVINKYPNNPKHLNNLAVTYLTTNRIEEARAILKRVLVKWPANGFALVHYGFILKTTDNELEKAVHYLESGIRTNDEGVIDGRFYFHLGDALTRLGKNDDALKIYEEGTRNKVFLSKYQRSLYNVPRLSAKSWWLPKELSYSKSLRLLSESWKKIREEGLATLNEKGYFQDESENLRESGEWKQFELYARGQKNVKNCKKCPFTCSIIDQIPEAKFCRRGQTKFSVMHPGTHVWAHCGPTNCRLRIHLGLKVPSHTFIRVAEVTKSWNEGEFLIFDDSFEHEVWHNGTDLRLILIVDVWHPELTPSERNSLSPI